MQTFLVIVFWTLFAAVLGGIVYLAHRLTAPMAKRMRENSEQAFYAAMAARGREIKLPRTWQSEGVPGHERRLGAELKGALGIAAAAVLAAFAVGVWARLPLAWGQVAGEALILALVFAGIYYGVRLHERSRVRRRLGAAGNVAPRTAFKVVANAHGLFVPVSDRVIEGAWKDWTVTDAEMVHGRYGIVACLSLTVAHRAEPGLKVPLIALTFDDGDALLEVIAAQAERVSS